MPNWTTNIVTITGSTETIKTIKDHLFSTDEDGELYLDFHKIVPRPLEYENTTAGSNTHWIKEFIKSGQEPTYDNFNTFIKENCTNKNLEVSEEEFNQSMYLVNTHGYIDWYDWNTNNWGTKWDADGTEIITDEPTELEFSFLTAWNGPEGIMNKIRETYPNVYIRHEEQHEGGFGGTITHRVAGEIGYSIIETHEIVVGYNKDGEKVELEYNEDTDEYEDSEGNVYECPDYEFVPYD